MGPWVVKAVRYLRIEKNTPPENKFPMKDQSANNKNTVMEERPVNNENILNPEIMEQVIEIIRNSTDNELTDDEKENLRS